MQPTVGGQPPAPGDELPADAVLTFEMALARLQEIVLILEEGSCGLEDSLARFEQGIGLLRNCYQILDRAEQKIELLVRTDAAGEVVMAPFDAAATAESTGKPQKKPGRRRASARTDDSREEPAPQPRHDAGAAPDIAAGGDGIDENGQTLF